MAHLRRQLAGEELQRDGGDEGLQGPDPGEANEAVGDQDAVRATALGLRNIRRVAQLLEPATTAQPGENYDDLREAGFLKLCVPKEHGGLGADDPTYMLVAAEVGG